MSVKLEVHRGREKWHVDVIRTLGGRKVRKQAWLDRRYHYKREALEKERELIAELEALRKGRVSAPVEAGRARSELPTFGSWAEVYMAEQDPSRGDHQNKRSHLDHHLLPQLGRLRLDEVDNAAIGALRKRLKAVGTGATSSWALRDIEPVSGRRKGRRSGATVNRVLGTLLRILNAAKAEGLLAEVPAIAKEPEAGPEDDFLYFDEADKFLAGAGDWWLFCLTGVRGGLREGELLELRGRDLAFDGATGPVIQVRRAVKFRRTGPVVGAPKCGIRRSVPMSSDLSQALGERAAGPGELVFPGTGGGWLDSHGVWRALADTGKRTLGRHVYCHLMRHTFASHAAMRGVPMRVLQRWLGHKHLRTTERYAHLAPGVGDEMIERLVPGGTGLVVIETEKGAHAGAHTNNANKKKASER